MRLCWFGIELSIELGLPTFYISLGPTTCDDEPELEVEPDPRGDSLTTFIGFAPSQEPPWEKPLNLWGEPSEDSEDV